MSHMVIFQTPDGNPGYNQFETLEEAVRFVEKLRNEQSVETARMFALEEVKFDFKPYFRVEVDPPAVGAGPAPSRPEPTPASRPATPSPPTPAFSTSAPTAASSPFSAPMSGVTFGDAPVGAGTSDLDSPVGGADPLTVGASASPPPPTFMSPSVAASTAAAVEADPDEAQTTRRGLFGR